MRISDWSSDVCSSDLGSKRSCSENRTTAASAMPIGMPGWPEAAASTASMASARMALARALWSPGERAAPRAGCLDVMAPVAGVGGRARSEEHTSELQSLMRLSYAVFCLKKKKDTKNSDDETDLR